MYDKRFAVVKNRNNKSFEMIYTPNYRVRGLQSVYIFVFVVVSWLKSKHSLHLNCGEFGNSLILHVLSLFLSLSNTHHSHLTSFPFIIIFLLFQLLYLPWNESNKKDLIHIYGNGEIRKIINDITSKWWAAYILNNTCLNWQS